ncbi:MAG TPA: hypothetical protein VGP77_06550 [Vicinamibacterales bacterium]|jgi:hypothetical protein|nr:hypothetical protein [Vicinamibacterales bacterium]
MSTTRSVTRRCLTGLVILGALTSSACFQMTTVLRVNGDGSGTINHRMVYTKAALAQLKSFAALGGNGRGAGAAADPLSEQQARDMTASIGPGVTYVASELITTPLGQGRDATYAFTDVSTLRISTQPAAPGGISIKTPGFNTQPSPSESITFTMTHEANGNAVLHIHVPEPNYLDFFGSPQAAGQIGMIKTLLAGARVLLAAEPAGTLVKTSSPFVEGPRVTLLDIDLDTVLADETLLPRIQAVAATPAEAKAVLLSAKGLKINLDPEITIEFTPAK